MKKTVDVFDPADSMTVVEACRALGVGIDQVYQLLAAGKLEGEKVDGRWRIPKKAIAERIAFVSQLRGGR